jgi:hypothetical protein
MPSDVDAKPPWTSCVLTKIEDRTKTSDQRRISTTSATADRRSSVRFSRRTRSFFIPVCFIGVDVLLDLRGLPLSPIVEFGPTHVTFLTRSLISRHSMLFFDFFFESNGWYSSQSCPGNSDAFRLRSSCNRSSVSRPDRCSMTKTSVPRFLHHVWCCGNTFGHWFFRADTNEATDPTKHPPQ